MQYYWEHEKILNAQYLISTKKNTSNDNTTKKNIVKGNASKCFLFHDWKIIDAINIGSKNIPIYDVKYQCTDCNKTKFKSAYDII